MEETNKLQSLIFVLQGEEISPGKKKATSGVSVVCNQLLGQRFSMSVVSLPLGRVFKYADV